jgi:hypothetical protein
MTDQIKGSGLHDKGKETGAGKDLFGVSRTDREGSEIVVVLF